MYNGKRYGLVLAGGIAKGAYQLGVLEAFKRRLPPDFFDYISATSVGILNGYAYATGQLDKAAKVWFGMDSSGIVDFFSKFSKHSYVQKLISHFDWDQLVQSPFYITLLQVPKVRVCYFDIFGLDRRSLKKYMQAGVTVPPFSVPIEINGTKYIDGALGDNIPAFPLLNKDLDAVIVVYFDDDYYMFENEEFDSKVIRLNFLESRIVHDSFDFTNDAVRNMALTGKQAADRVIDAIIAGSGSAQCADGRTVPQVLKVSDFSRRTKRVSGDVIFSNINRYSRKLLKYNVINDAEFQRRNRDSFIHVVENRAGRKDRGINYYLKNGLNSTFDESPFGEVDALIFSWLSYYEFENILGEDYTGEMTLSQIVSAHNEKFGVIRIADPRIDIIPAQTAAYLLSKIARSARFRDTRLTRFRSLLDDSRSTQFAAASFACDGFCVVSFRGTDDTLAGWREDFELSFRDSLYSQAMSLRFLEQYLADRPGMPLYLCGHSKGGNLAVFTALQTDPEKGSCIRKIFNFDGPGMNRPLSDLPYYEYWKPRIATLLPASSIVGRLLQGSEGYYEIIDCDSPGILQHNALLWKISGRSFVRIDRFTRTSDMMAETMASWISGLDRKEKAYFTDMLFSVMYEAGISRFTDLNENGLLKIQNTLKNTAAIPMEDKLRLIKIIQPLVTSGMNTMSEYGRKSHSGSSSGRSRRGR